MIYDTHAHPYLASKKSQDTIIHNITSTGGFLNSIGVDISSSKKSVELAKKCSNVYASIGIHPCDILVKGELLDLEDTLSELEELYLKNKEEILAIGETGLDFHWLKSMSKDYLLSSLGVTKYNALSEEELEKHLASVSDLLKKYQKLFFKAQISLAKTYNLPFIIHNRNSKEDVLKIIQEEGYENFIFHCFSEDYDYAKKVLKYAPEAMLSFSGTVTFKNAKQIQEAAASIPLKNILIETDSPYLTPEPLRGKEENEPLFVHHVLQKIVELRNESSTIISSEIFLNSQRVFGMQEII